MLMQEINRKRWSRSSGREKQKEDLNGRARPPDYREYQLSQKEWMQYLIMGAGAAGLCAYTFYRSVLAFLFLLPVAFLYPVYKKKDLKKERIRLFSGKQSFVKCKRIGRPLWKNRDDHRRVFLYGSRGKDEPSGGTAFS